MVWLKYFFSELNGMVESLYWYFYQFFIMVKVFLNAIDESREDEFNIIEIESG